MTDNRKKNILFTASLLLIAINHLVLFFVLHFNYIDTDQPVMWLGAKDFSEGHFYVPRYYGQDYNTMLEALLAVPFLRIGLPVYIAVPLVTHLLGLFPFIFASCYLFFTGRKEQAIVILAILLCMSTGFDIISSVPRGFVTGLFFTSFFILSLCNPKNYLYLLLNSFLAFVAYEVNPNSVVVSLPCLFYLWLLNMRELRFYIFAGAGVLAASPISYFLNHFYMLHPNYIVHKGLTGFSVKVFMNAITHLGQRFCHLGLFFEQQSPTFVLLFAMVLLLFYYESKPLFYSVLVLLVLILISLAHNKTHDGTAWVYYSFSRMYLGVPLVFILLISLIEIKAANAFYGGITLLLLFGVFKIARVQSTVANHMKPERWDHLQVASLSDIQQYLTNFSNLAKEHKVDEIVVLENFWRQDFIVYGGPALYPDYPLTFNPYYDRRNWRFRQEDTTVRKSFLILCGRKDYFDPRNIDMPKNVAKLDDWGAFLVTDNDLTTIGFMRKCKAEIAPY
jgi:hypothetical protein